ncbi:MAG TPA: 2Fe-2S iron-sulfur cluster-binding protein [Fibrobacteria bacterium]|nr:2Fe-2S iron-sulfur cluster-binding protein [Fibrobacteria bacterium]
MLLGRIRKHLDGFGKWIAGWRRCVVDDRELRYRGGTLHDAMTENGIDPGGSCRRGRCGRCRVGCVQGGYRLLDARGWAGQGDLLACQVVPRATLRCRRTTVDSRSP